MSKRGPNWLALPCRPADEPIAAMNAQILSERQPKITVAIPTYRRDQVLIDTEGWFLVDHAGLF